MAKRRKKPTKRAKVLLTDSQITKALDEDDNLVRDQISNPQDSDLSPSDVCENVPVPGITSYPVSVPSAVDPVFDLSDIAEAGGVVAELETLSQEENLYDEPSFPEVEPSAVGNVDMEDHDYFGTSQDDNARSKGFPEITSELSDMDSEAGSTRPDPDTKKKLASNRRMKQQMKGRTWDPVWGQFNVQKSGKIITSCTCKACGQEISAKVPRLRLHVKKCSKPGERRLNSDDVSAHGAPLSPGPVPSASCKKDPSVAKSPSSRITSFLDRMSASDQNQIDNLLGRFIFGCNLPFRIVENKKFITFVKKLRPAYEIPKRQVIQTQLLDQIFKECSEEVAEDLKNKHVTIQQDGWSTRQNAPVIAHSVSTGTRNYFISACATETNSKTALFCLSLLEKEIENVEQKFSCKIIGSVTDNCATMRLMRDTLSINRPELLVYGCHSHLLNLVGQELTPDELKSDVVEVQKFFRNHHFPAASLKRKQGKRPVLPGDTRWNSQLDCFESFLANQTKYLDISREKEAKMPECIKKLVSENSFYEQVHQATKILLPVARALDKLQGDQATLGDAVSIWLTLDEELGVYNENIVFKEKYKMAMTPVAVAAYMLHPKYKGRGLPVNLKNTGDDFLATRNPLFVVIASELKIKSEDTFPKALLDDSVVTKMNPANWWKSVGMDIRLPVGLLDLATKLASLPCSTGGLERSFSVLGRIMTNCRSRLGVEKAAKLCFIYSHLRSQDTSVTFFDDSDLD